ncbi:pyrroloquinoline quinone-dependent dehydrogenase [Brevundimonas sp.]|uniref:pyrroloquinoline quinone-dependent dehydrogenase n=1 Tax=Brevundimonas sp. TaxID=1871086 RepID=UPI0019BCEABF|nr:pyrroloquinoline quinone-dependent dehydrogenase [Brevundimonas sp.]MBD3836703.1 pyrroloquinoline quinone-dependent dehydrogenase [Brevundimonas sp.]
MNSRSAALWMGVALQAVALAVVPAAQARQAAVAANGDWSTYGHDKGGMRYSPLTQITPANVAQLQPAWTFHMRPAAATEASSATGAAAQAQAVSEGVAPPAARPGGGSPFGVSASGFAASQVTPLVVDGLMYLTTPYKRVVALEPETGREVWAYEVSGPGQPTQRGLEYWPGDAQTPARVLFGTRDGKLIALNARTGRPAEGFGVDGVVDLKTPEIMNGQAQASYGMTSPPLVFGDLVITGSAVQEGGGPGASGNVRAWNVRTGELVWTLHSIAQEGQPGAESWSAGSTDARSGVNVWGFMTVDEAAGVVYVPIGAPAWDRYGGDRVGDNLFSTSLVAADARTGRYLWHFQVVHHDVWDFDLASPPTLITVQKDGQSIPAVAIVGKVGYMFILDRRTGQPIYSVVETPVPGSDVPGEVTAPTQPIPSKPEPLARVTINADELSHVTPEHQAFCEALVRDNDMLLGGPYLPTQLDRLTVNMPGTLGGTNWGGGAFDPVSGLYIVNTFDLGQIQSLTATPEGSTTAYTNRSPLFGRFWEPASRMPCQAPPWGQLVAVDVNTGDIAWRSTLGVTEALPDDIQKTGRPSIGGPIVTAGGVVFIGATDDRRFRAFDAHTGEELWSTELPSSAHATPMTFQGRDGRQYVVISASGGSFLASPVNGDEVIAYALPKAQ